MDLNSILRIQAEVMAKAIAEEIDNEIMCDYTLNSFKEILNQ